MTNLKPPEASIKMFSNKCWSAYRLQSELEESGFPSDGYTSGPAISIVDWKQVLPSAHSELCQLSNNEIATLFDAWQLGTDEWGGFLNSNRDIIESLLGEPWFPDKYPIPSLFGWPLSSYGQRLAVETGQMPLIVFEELNKEFGDWIEVFSDTSFWTYGFYI